MLITQKKLHNKINTLFTLMESKMKYSGKLKLKTIKEYSKYCYKIR